MSQLGYRIKKVGEIIVTVPDDFKSEPGALVFGGLYYATPNWMMEQVPKSLLRNKPFCFIPWQYTIDEVKRRIEGIKISSVSGFSKGGLRAYPAIGQGYNFVGLIDPSIEGSYTSVKIPQNSDVVVVYQKGRQWGSSSLKYAINKLKDSGVEDIYSVSLGHSDIPKFFFNKFGDKL
jgi:hypothetical protein